MTPMLTWGPRALLGAGHDDLRQVESLRPHLVTGEPAAQPALELAPLGLLVDHDHVESLALHPGTWGHF